MIDLPHNLSTDNYTGGEHDNEQLETRLNRSAIEFAREFANSEQIDRWIFDPSGKVNGAATEAGKQHNLDYAKLLRQRSS